MKLIVRKIISRDFNHRSLKDRCVIERKLSREILTIDHSKITVKLIVRKIISRNFNHQSLKDQCEIQEKLSREILTIDRSRSL